jgi:hypothetical protein
MKSRPLYSVRLMSIQFTTWTSMDVDDVDVDVKNAT